MENNMAHSTTRIVDDKPASKLSEAYGSSLPWAEPSWYEQFLLFHGTQSAELINICRYTGRPSPYYKESHRKLRDYVRAWCDEVCPIFTSATSPCSFTRLKKVFLEPAQLSTSPISNLAGPLNQNTTLTTAEHRPLQRRLGTIRRRRSLHLRQMRLRRPPRPHRLRQDHPAPIQQLPDRSRHKTSRLGRLPRLHPLGRTNPRRSNRIDIHRARRRGPAPPKIRFTATAGKYIP